MNKSQTGRFLGEELGRVLVEFKTVGEQAARLAAESKRLALAGRHLLFILRELMGEPEATKLIRDLDLTDLVAGLPDVPDAPPSPAAKAKATAKPPRPSAPVAASVEALVKGVPVRMLDGKYKGFTGRVQAVHTKGDTRTYAVSLIDPDGRTVPNQVSERSRGSKWEAIAATPRSVLPKGTRVRLLVGKYAGAEGEIGYTTTKGSTVTYTVSLAAKDGARARTQVNQGSQDRTWQVVGQAGPVVTPEPAPAAATVPASERRPIRRPGSKATPPAPADSPAAAPLPSTVVPRGTRVQVLKGMYQGRNGVVGYTQARGTSVVYTLNIDGHRTQVNHGTLGTSWAIVTDASPARVPDVEPAPAAAEAPIVQAAPPSPAPEPRSEPVPPPTPLVETALLRVFLAKGTLVRMLTGHYLGCTGTVTGVHPIPGPKPDAIYTLAVTGKDGGKVRTSMKHSSLGRAWVKVD